MQRMDQVADELRERQPETVTRGEIDAYQGELNDLCPYIGEQCQIAGNGQWPIFDSDGENVGEEWRYETGMIAESHGVAIERLDQDAYYRPYHKFYLGFAKRRDRATKEAVFNNYALLDRMGSIVLKRTVDDVFSDDESRSIFIPADFDTNLQAHSDWFRSNLTSRAFRRRTLTSQQQFVDNYLAFVTDKFKLERAGVSFVATYCLRAASLSVL
ncbi:MAG TPA: hypothetical protein VFH39_04570, partial [Candidatus Saccharimonadales bacterium]|nr:hypothetical protein [Candidatus Saccharimonadales bacterium]